MPQVYFNSDIAGRLEKAVEAALNRPEFVSARQKFGFVPAFMPSEEFDLLIARDDGFISRQIQMLGLNRKQ